jgi:hypothetical protein
MRVTSFWRESLPRSVRCPGLDARRGRRYGPRSHVSAAKGGRSRIRTWVGEADGFPANLSQQSQTPLTSTNAVRDRILGCRPIRVRARGSGRRKRTNGRGRRRRERCMDRPFRFRRGVQRCPATWHCGVSIELKDAAGRAAASGRYPMVRRSRAKPVHDFTRAHDSCHHFGDKVDNCTRFSR